MEFKKVRKILTENFESIATSNQLFDVDIDNDYLLNLYTLKNAMLLDDVIGRIYDHSVGVLLVDISEGIDLDSAVRCYEKIVSPTNYKRLKAIGDFDSDLIAKIDIVRYIFKDKEDEAAVHKDTAVKAAKKHHTLEIIARNEENVLQNMSKDELMKILNELG